MPWPLPAHPYGGAALNRDREDGVTAARATRNGHPEGNQPAGPLRAALPPELGGSLRDIGRADAGVKLLTAELSPSTHELDGAVRGCLASLPSGSGRDREGLALVWGVAAGHLPCCRRSLANRVRASADPAR
jgi:tetratricopeptide repeat protein